MHRHLFETPLRSPGKTKDIYLHDTLEGVRSNVWGAYTDCKIICGFLELVKNYKYLYPAR